MKLNQNEFSATRNLPELQEFFAYRETFPGSRDFIDFLVEMYCAGSIAYRWDHSDDLAVRIWYIVNSDPFRGRLSEFSVESERTIMELFLEGALEIFIVKSDMYFLDLTEECDRRDDQKYSAA